MTSEPEPKIDSDYYQWAKGMGLDYLHHGPWQIGYAKAIADAVGEWPTNASLFLDIGSACGSQLKAFKDLGVFNAVKGVEQDGAMVKAGRETFGFLAGELKKATVPPLDIDDRLVSVVHCSHVLEHMEAGPIRKLAAEVFRVLRSGGCWVVVGPTLKQGQEKADHAKDSTHVTIARPGWWDVLFHEAGFVFDAEALGRMARSDILVEDRNYLQTYDRWTVWCLRKP